MENSTPSQNSESFGSVYSFPLSSVMVTNKYEPPIVKVCRICMEEQNRGFVAPCKCAGSMKYVHANCLKMWLIKLSTTLGTKKFKSVNCEVCSIKYAFDFQKDKELKWSQLTRNYYHNKTEYYQFLVVGIIVIVLILAGIVGIVQVETNQTLRAKTDSIQSVKIGLIAMELILVCILVSLVIVFLVEYGVKGAVVISRIYDYFPGKANIRNNKITPY